MILILNILDNNNAKWHLLNDDQVKEHNFDMLVGEENILPELAQLVTKEAIDFSDLSGLALAIKESSLTQVKVATTILNSLGWQWSIPVVAYFDYLEKEQEILAKAKNDLAQKEKFVAIKPEYAKQAEITISKKKNKFKIED
ncbi:hypothetical protein H6761_01975 [Candidatus Nomurabacteria bacterium]|nr:hypothetical protein [Candidatus Nomurabacteria bacterium]